jgi:TetR/AcrR family transcriptional regulator, transcriptional repressor of bet genes
MPKIVDHEKRRDDIALVACRVVATHGFEQATVARIAKETGYTTGMIAHYFESKQEIILAALRLNLRRIEERLSQGADPRVDLLAVLAEALPIDEQRFTECAFWTAFWGQVSADRKLKRLNAWVHREYHRLFERCLRSHWPEWQHWPAELKDDTLRSLITFLNGVTASAVANHADWPPERQLAQLDLQLRLLRRHALESAGSITPPVPARHATRAAPPRATANQRR